MNAYMSEEEQIQKIKDWWKKYGNTIIVGLIIFLGLSFGWRYWHSYKAKRAEQASILYEQALSAEMSHKMDSFKLYADQLINNYASSPYASFASFMLAREAVYANKLREAEQHLQWVIDHSGSKGFKQIARIRAARVLLTNKQPPKALELLQKVVDKAYQSVVAELQGDIYIAMGNKANALSAYKTAIAEISKKGLTSPILEMKINQVQQ